MLHPSIRPIYRKAVESIQRCLEERGDSHQITQSLVELWKFIYTKLPRVGVAKVPGYPENRMDQQEIAFHCRVREGYLQMVAAEPERWVVIEAAQPVDVAQRAIRAKVEAKLPVPQ